jgi:hypothetical protein
VIKVAERDRFQHRKVRCSTCSNAGTLEIKLLPKDFFMRLEYDEDKLRFFERIKMPFYKGYFASAIIQFSRRLKHFRVLKLFGRNRTDVIDNQSIVRFHTEE